MLRSVLTLLLVLVATLTTQAQEVVVSAYYDNPAPEQEWTEFLVVTDNISLVGYHITDYDGTQTSRAGGVTFRNVPLWRHLREGTIIVILSGDYTAPRFEDTDIADGFVQISRKDIRFFDPYLTANGLSINAAADYVEILTPNERHVHGLGHGRPSGPGYNQSAMPRILADVEQAFGLVVNVVARSVGGYGADRNNDSTSITTFTTADYEGKQTGLPNRRPPLQEQQGFASLNHLLWRELREPEWTAKPQIGVTGQTDRSITLEWTPLVDPYPNDSSTGVVILRDSLNYTNQTYPIRDGIELHAGMRIGSVLVVAMLPTALGNTYTDTTVTCGTSYIYKVYGYRYSDDDVLPFTATPDFTARGRQVTEASYAETPSIDRPGIDVPPITVSRRRICPSDTVTLNTTATADRYEWLRNNLPVGGGTTARFIARGTGTYRLRVYTSTGCFSDSDPVQVSAMDAPRAEILPRGVHTLCTGDSLILGTPTVASSYAWYLNGTAIPGATSARYAAQAPGTYNVRIGSAEGCDGYSQGVTIRFAAVHLAASAPTVDFGQMGGCLRDTTATVQLLNTGDATLYVTAATFTSGFGIVDPPTGFEIAPGARRTVTLRFTPQTTGITTGTVNFSVLPCSTGVSIALRGELSDASVALGRASVDYGIFTACDTTTSINPDSTVTIVNNGTVPVTVRTPSVSAPFQLLGFGEVTLQPGQTAIARFRYAPTGAYLDQAVTQQIRFPYESGACTGTLRLTLRGTAYKPTVTFAPSVVDAGVLDACGRPVIDTFIVVTNTRPIPANIVNASGSDITMPDLPLTLSAGTSTSIGIDATVPSTPGPFSMSAQLAVLPCRSIQSITIRGVATASIVTFVPSSIDLGTSSVCGAAQPQATVRIRMPGTNGQIVSAQIDAPFAVTIGNTNFKDSTTLVVEYLAGSSAAGTFIDTLVVTVDPCGRVLNIPVRVVVTDVGYGIVCGCDFGILDAGGSHTDSIVVSNTSATALVVEALLPVNPPFVFVSATPGLPATIPPGGTAVVRFRYDYAGAGRADTAIAGFSVQTDTCLATIERTLVGATRTVVDPPDTVDVDGLILALPETLRATPGDEFRIPVALLAPVPLDNTGVTDITAVVKFNASMMRMLDAIVPGGSDITVTVNESTPGRALVTISSPTSVLTGDPIFDIRARAYLGNDTITRLNVDSAVSNYRPIRGRDGQLAMLAQCGMEAQTASLGTDVAVSVQAVTPTDIVVDIGTLTDDPVRLAIYDMRGRECLVPIDGFVRPGRYQLRIPHEQLRAGTYVLAITNSTFVCTTLVAIVR